jgi:hypothetical protein
MSINEIMKKTIDNSGLSEERKQSYIKQLETATSTTEGTSYNKPQEILRGLLSNPVLNTSALNLGFNPSAIMRDTYKPAFSFKSNETRQTQQQQPQQQQVQKQVDNKNIKKAIIITKEQETGIDKSGNPEIIKSSIQIVQQAKPFKKFNDKRVPVNQNQPFKYSDETPLFDEKIVDKQIPFSKKLSR